MDEINTFWHINFGNLLNILMLMIGGLSFVYILRGRVDSLFERMLHVEEKLEQLVTVLVEQGKQSERMILMNERIQAQGRRLDEIERRANKYLEGK